MLKVQRCSSFSKGYILLPLCIKLQGPLHHANTSVKIIPPYTPLLYSKTGIYSGVHYFLNFALKHGRWVLVRTTSMRQF